MSRSVNRALYQSAPQLLLRDAVRTTLEATFSAARLILSWDDPPIVVPGFQVRANGAHAIVRYIQPHDGKPQVRRARARAMLEQYRDTIMAEGWQADIVDERGKVPYLRCYLTTAVMSNEGE